MNENNFEGITKDYFSKYIAIVQQVIMAPAEFYRQMPKSGGLVDPLIFMIVMGVVGGILRAILGVLGIGFAVSFLVAIGSIVLVPIFVVIVSFIGAGVVFVIWKLMGSQESFETAYRCFAYAGAISPITVVLDVIPYIGPVLGVLWITYILVNASVEVHRLEPRLSWIVFGIIGAVLCLASISAQISARRMATNMTTFQNQMKNMQNMKPEEAGKAMGQFLKGMQKGSQ